VGRTAQWLNRGGAATGGPARGTEPRMPDPADQPAESAAQRSAQTGKTERTHTTAADLGRRGT
jgi:hypothetical protein